MKKLSILFAAILSITFSGLVSGSSWTTIYNHDEDRQLPYLQCEIEEFGPTGMSENDQWFFIQNGVLSPGDTWQVSNPRPLCMSSQPVRIGWRFIGKGKAPSGISMRIIDPVNGAQYRLDHTTVVSTKGGRPTWVRQCTNVGGSDALGTYIFQITNNGSVAVNLRVAASIAMYEFEIQQCPNWSQTLSNYGI